MIDGTEHEEPAGTYDLDLMETMVEEPRREDSKFPKAFRCPVCWEQIKITTKWEVQLPLLQEPFQA